MAHSYARGFLARMPVVMGKVTEPRDDGIKHGNIDELAAASLFTLIERQKNADGRVHAGSNIDDGETRPSGLVGITCSGDNSPFALNEEIVRFDIAVRSVLTVAGQGAVNQPWV